MIAVNFFAVGVVVTALLSYTEAFVSLSTHRSISASAVARPTGLRMGLLDSVLSKFKNKRDGDFVKLEDMNDQFFGPGPVVLLYNIPDAIVDDEVMDILSDGAPMASKKTISIGRITAEAKQSFSLEKNKPNTNNNLFLLDLSLNDALEAVIQKKSSPDSTESSSEPPSPAGSPVVIFSGFSSTEMMASYNILGEEVYKETASSGGSGMVLACAVAVPNAMGKSLRQVVSEISGDHAEAMRVADDEKITDESIVTNRNENELGNDNGDSIKATLGSL